MPFNLLNLERNPLLHDTMNMNDTNDTSSEEIALFDLSGQIQPSAFVCMPSKRYERFFSTYIPIFDILLVALIPFLLICSSNIGIIVYTMRKNRQMQQHRKRAHRRHQRLTIMLLSVTLAFIGLTCPSVIVICANKIIQAKSLQRDEKTHTLNVVSARAQTARVQSINDVCEALWYTKHAMNFILYTMSGQDFRREFIKLFTQCFPSRPPILKKLMRKTPAQTTSTAETALIEIPIIINANNKK